MLISCCNSSILLVSKKVLTSCWSVESGNCLKIQVDQLASPKLMQKDLTLILERQFHQGMHALAEIQDLIYFALSTYLALQSFAN